MSHTATVQTQVRRPKMIQKAAKALGFSCSVGQFRQQFFQSKAESGDVAVTLPGWKYPVLFDTKTGEVKYDNYNGMWGDLQPLEKLMQEYALQVAEEEAQEFTLQGWTMQRVVQPNGDVQIVLEH